MKNKFLTFVVAICMILPCLFMLTACDIGGSGGSGVSGGDGVVCVIGHTYVITFNDDMTEAYLEMKFPNKTSNYTFTLVVEE